MTLLLWLPALLAIGPIGAPVVPVSVPIRRVTTARPAVALTFDACATRSRHYGFDRGIFEVLKREGVPATVFISGRWAETHPEAMAELRAQAHIEFGDHSYDHPHMSRLAARQMEEEIDRTEAILARYGRRSVAFRPPFGDWNQSLLGVAQGRQLPAVLWDVESGDPNARTTTAGMIRNVMRKVRPGSIVVFHINGRARKTAEALPLILRELRARGFELVTLSELLAARPPAPPEH